VDVVDPPVTIVVDVVPVDLTRVHPDVVGEVRMHALDAGIQHATTIELEPVAK
jgi:hypothetical protein